MFMSQQIMKCSLGVYRDHRIVLHWSKKVLNLPESPLWSVNINIFWVPNESFKAHILQY